MQNFQFGQLQMFVSEQVFNGSVMEEVLVLFSGFRCLLNSYFEGIHV